MITVAFGTAMSVSYADFCAARTQWVVLSARSAKLRVGSARPLGTMGGAAIGRSSVRAMCIWHVSDRCCRMGGWCVDARVGRMNRTQQRAGYAMCKLCYGNDVIYIPYVIYTLGGVILDPRCITVTRPF